MFNIYLMDKTSIIYYLFNKLSYISLFNIVFNYYSDLHLLFIYELKFVLSMMHDLICLS